MLALHAGGLSKAEVAEQLGRTYGSTRKALERYGSVSRKGWTSHDVARLKEGLAEGKTRRIIGMRLGRSASAVTHAINRYLAA